MTQLKKWHYVEQDGYKVYTCDTWVLPEEQTQIFCTSWIRGQTIEPYGDGAHVIVGFSVYHCDEFMGILERQESKGFSWGIEGVTMSREQQINGQWKKVSVL